MSDQRAPRPATRDASGIDAHGATDQGRARESNQDQFLIAELERALYVHGSSLPHTGQIELRGPAFAQLFAVADGVGGQAGGDRASLLAVRSLLEYTLHTLPWCVRLDPSQDDDLIHELRFGLTRAQERLQAEAQRDPRQARMATTLTQAFVVWPRAWVIHVGDSRCYHLRAGALAQVTEDHTVARELAAQGVITDSGARRSPWKDVLWNTLGAGEQVADPRVHRVELEPGDALLLCTDGLTKHVSDGRLQELLAADEPSATTCGKLIERANAGGGSDNITAVVARFPRQAAGALRLQRT